MLVPFIVYISYLWSNIPAPAQLGQQKYDLITYCCNTYKVSNERRQHCHGQRCYTNDKSNNVSCNIVVFGLYHRKER